MARGRAALKRTPPTPEDDPILDSEQVATMLNCSVDYVMRLCRKGRLVVRGIEVKGPYLIGAKFGNKWRIRRSEVFKLVGRLEAVGSKR